jgi:hypothetical protein
MTRWLVPLTLAALVFAAPAEAQEWQVSRDQFAFAGRQLTVHVDVDAEGSLRIIRGPAGQVRVSSRADFGLTAAGLTADEQLTLTHGGEGPVEYVITVPERVWIDVRLPDRPTIESMGSHDRAGIFHWAAAGVVEDVVVERPYQPAPAPARPATRPAGQVTGLWSDPVAPQPRETAARLTGGASFTAMVTPGAPALVRIPDLTNVRSITVQVEGSVFRVKTSRPMTLTPGSAQHLEIRPGGPPMDIALVVPPGTPGFRLDALHGPILTVQGSEVRVLCGSSTQQWLPGGRAWVTFTPVQGALECSPAPRGVDTRVAGNQGS